MTNLKVKIHTPFSILKIEHKIVKVQIIYKELKCNFYS